jgi:hypothetical protein
MPPTDIKPAIPVSERPQTHALYRAATGIDIDLLRKILYVKLFSVFVICYAELVLCVKSLRNLRDVFPAN